MQTCSAVSKLGDLIGRHCPEIIYFVLQKVIKNFHKSPDVCVLQLIISCRFVCNPIFSHCSYLSCQTFPEVFLIFAPSFNFEAYLQLSKIIMRISSRNGQEVCGPFGVNTETLKTL